MAFLPPEIAFNTSLLQLIADPVNAQKRLADLVSQEQATQVALDRVAAASEALRANEEAFQAEVAPAREKLAKATADAEAAKVDLEAKTQAVSELEVKVASRLKDLDLVVTDKERGVSLRESSVSVREKNVQVREDVATKLQSDAQVVLDEYTQKLDALKKITG